MVVHQTVAGFVGNAVDAAGFVGSGKKSIPKEERLSFGKCEKSIPKEERLSFGIGRLEKV